MQICMKDFALNRVPERIDPQQSIIRLQECFSESGTTIVQRGNKILHWACSADFSDSMQIACL